LQVQVAVRLRSRHAGGVLPQPLFMEEGNWIDMTGISLITAEGTATEGGAATDTKGGDTETGRGADHEAEGLIGQGAEAAHDDRAKRTVPAVENAVNDAERAMVAEDVALMARTSPEAAAMTAEDAVRAPVEEVNETARGPTGGDTDDVEHVAELEVALLAVNSSAHKAHPEDAGAAETDPPPAAAAKAEV
jgi:hypothetical protein